MELLDQVDQEERQILMALSQDPNEFTNREKFILSYFRDRKLSNPRQFLSYDIAIIVASIVCLILAIIQEELDLGLVAYSLVLSRLGYHVVETLKWSRDYQSIFRKYDAKLEAAEERKKDI
jgi:hypothetical protein